MEEIRTLDGYAPIGTVARAIGVKEITLRKHVQRKGIHMVSIGWNTLIKPESVAGYQPRHYNHHSS